MMPPPGLQIYLPLHVTLTFDLLHPGYCDTMSICRNVPARFGYNASDSSWDIWPKRIFGPIFASCDHDTVPEKICQFWILMAAGWLLELSVHASKLLAGLQQPHRRQQEKPTPHPEIFRRMPFLPRPFQFIRASPADTMLVCTLRGGLVYQLY